MTSFRVRWFVAIVLPAVLLSRAAGAEPQRWLNVKDCGASGSVVEAKAASTAGAKQITLLGRGDFQAGQEVMLSGCNPHYEKCQLRPPTNPFSTNPLGDAAELRGYDGSAGSWIIYILEVDGVSPLSFRWTDDLARTWKAKKVPVTFDWQPLGGGTEIKLRRRDLQLGHIITFAARDLLVTEIEKVEGSVLTLKHAPTRTAKDAVVRHCDTAALQKAIVRAMRENLHVFFPAGYYRLTDGLWVSNPQGIVLEGASGAETVLDISEGNGACVHLIGGSEVTVRNLSLMGHTALGEGPGWRSFKTSNGLACWPVGMKPCQAIQICNTRRVLIENCHASRMNCEAFYCQGDNRSSTREPKAYTQSLTYLRCSATNCDGNAFNNNDLAENTSVLYCRIQDIGGCSWEGASRFVRFIGNYVRNAGPIAMGNIGSRIEDLEKLGSGQHIVADNVFESRTFYAGRSGGPILRAAHGATQVIIRNNLFVNFASSGIEITGIADNRHLPAGIALVTGNILDLTNIGDPRLVRSGMNVTASNVIVADNQIYVRGECDRDVVGIQIREPAVNVVVHDNLIRNCGRGIATERAVSVVQEVADPRTFLCVPYGAIGMERRLSHCYRGWNLAWLSGERPNTLSVIEGFDPESLRFTLRQPHPMKVGDRLAVYPPSANWSIHDNTLTGCLSPLVLDSYGSETSLLRDNLVSRGEATGVKQAIQVRGQFSLIGNHVYGFDEPGSTALGLFRDHTGKPLASVYHRNTFERCAGVVSDADKPLWDTSSARDNVFVECAAPGSGPAPKPSR